MIASIGNFSLVLAFAVAIFSSLFLYLGHIKKQANLVLAGERCCISVLGLILIAYAALTYSFLINDFSVWFVSKSSSTDLPLFYKISGVWGGLEGSLLLWAAILAIYTVMIIFQNRRLHKEILPCVVLSLNFIQIFLLLLLIVWSNPLAENYPIPAEGQGLNPLLQDPAMVIHPPMLYLGFVGMSVPFAFAMGTLITGKFDNVWIYTTRRWTLAAWLFLTAGMIIGGQWAYYELGWGGYWAWDPVENSSFIPWLTATAFIHSSLVQEKRNTLKIWNYLLVISTFVLTILGTFITRAGLLNSVHAFSESNIGPAFLIFIFFIVCFSIGFLFYRLPLLETSYPVRGILAKENSILANNIFLQGLAFTVLYGTLFPLLSEGITAQKVSVQAPFFNTISLPIAVILIILMGLTPYMAWNKTNPRRFRNYLIIPAVVSLLLMAFCSLFLNVQWQFVFLSGAIYFAGHATLIELYKTQKYHPNNSKEKKIHRTYAERRKWGGLLTHIGVLVFLIGICGNFFGLEKSFTAEKGNTYDVGPYTFLYNGNEVFPYQNAQHSAAVFNIFKDKTYITTLKPAKAFYPTTDEPTTEAAIHRTILQDIYINLASINEDQSATVTVYINPLIIFIQASLFFFVIGILLSVNYKSPHITSFYKKYPPNTKN